MLVDLSIPAKMMGTKLHSKPEAVINKSPWESPEEVYESYFNKLFVS